MVAVLEARASMRARRHRRPRAPPRPRNRRPRARPGRRHAARHDSAHDERQGPARGDARPLPGRHAADRRPRACDAMDLFDKLQPLAERLAAFGDGPMPFDTVIDEILEPDRSRHRRPPHADVRLEQLLRPELPSRRHRRRAAPRSSATAPARPDRAPPTAPTPRIAGSKRAFADALRQAARDGVHDRLPGEPRRHLRAVRRRRRGARSTSRATPASTTARG